MDTSPPADRSLGSDLGSSDGEASLPPSHPPSKASPGGGRGGGASPSAAQAAALRAAAATARRGGHEGGAAKLEALANQVQGGNADVGWGRQRAGSTSGSKTPGGMTTRQRSSSSGWGGGVGGARGGSPTASLVTSAKRDTSLGGWEALRAAAGAKSRRGSVAAVSKGGGDKGGATASGGASMADLARDVSDAFRRAVRHGGVTAGVGTGAVGGRARLNPFMTAVGLLAAGAPESRLVQEYAEALKRQRPRERWAQIGADLTKGGAGGVKGGGNVMNQLSAMHRVALGEARAGGVTVEASRAALRRLQRVCRVLPEEGGGAEEAPPQPPPPAKGRGHRRAATQGNPPAQRQRSTAGSKQTGDAKDSSIGAKGGEGGVIPYALQGDLRFYSVQYLLRRNRLRYSARVRAVLRLWYRAAKTRVPGTPAGIWGVGRATYVSILTSLWPVLNPSGTPDEGLVLAELDWERDIALVQDDGKGGAGGSTPRAGGRRRRSVVGGASPQATPKVRVVFLPEHAFNDTMFELADVWTETTSESEYCAFLIAALRHWVGGVQGGLPALPGVGSLLGEGGSSPTSRTRAPDRATDVALARWLVGTPPLTPFTGVRWGRCWRTRRGSRGGLQLSTACSRGPFPCQRRWRDCPPRCLKGVKGGLTTPKWAGMTPTRTTC